MQPISGYQWTRVSGTAAGTVAVSVGPAAIRRVIIGANKEGTVTFYDNLGGTSAATQVMAFNNNSGSIPTSLPIDAQFRNAITVAKGGTTDLTVVWQ